MTVLMQETNQTMIVHCYLRLEQWRYAVAVTRNGFKPDD